MTNRILILTFIIILIVTFFFLARSDSKEGMGTPVVGIYEQMVMQGCLDGMHGTSTVEFCTEFTKEQVKWQK